MKEKCKHGRDPNWCCACRYGNSGKHDLSPDPENPRDTLDDFKKAEKNFKRGFKIDF